MNTQTGKQLTVESSIINILTFSKAELIRPFFPANFRIPDFDQLKSKGLSKSQISNLLLLLKNEAQKKIGQEMIFDLAILVQVKTDSISFLLSLDIICIDNIYSLSFFRIIWFLLTSLVIVLFMRKCSF